MSVHEYTCPTCGVTLQAAQDVAGRKVRCLGCQATFIAQVAARPVVPRPPEPKRRPPMPAVEAEAPAPYLPPLPRKRKIPVGVFVVAAVLVCAIGATVFAINRFKNAVEDRDKVALAAKTEKEKEKAAPAKVKISKSDPQPIVKPETPPVAPVVPAARKDEEEEPPPSKPEPLPKPPEKAEPKLPDINSILPKLPGPDKPTKPGPTEERPKPPAVEPTETRPTETRPTEPTPTPSKAGPAEVPTSVDGQISTELLGKLKAATVFVRVDAGSFGATGSGFVLRVTGDTALIVTNHHVAEPKSKQGVVQRNVAHEIVFHSGRKNEFTKKAELIGADEEHDLAILRVIGVQKTKDFPEPLNTTDRLKLSETMPIYIMGFPFGKSLSTVKGNNPALTIGKGTISSVREDDAGDTAYIQLNGDVNSGNSGGPVVDSRGRLVGIAVASIDATQIGMAIPAVELTRLMSGRVTNLKFRVSRVVGNNVEMDVQGDLSDPLGRVKSSSLRVVRGDELKKKPEVGADSKWAALPGADKKTDFSANGRTVTCRVSLPLRTNDRGRLDFHFQPACIDRDGKTSYFAPVSQTLNISERGRGESFPPAPGGFVPMPPGLGLPGGPPSVGPMPPIGQGGIGMPPSPPGIMPPGSGPGLPGGAPTIGPGGAPPMPPRPLGRGNMLPGGG